MIDVNALRSKLIEAAIQGKLTEQQSKDGTAEELFVQIQAEKQALVKAKKIKKGKPLPPIAEDEIPFKIPKTWKWVYLGEIFQHQSGKALNAKDIEGNLYDYITTSNVYWNRLELNNLKKMRFKQTELDKYTIKKGDLLVCEGGDIGRSAIWTYDCEMRFQNHIHRLRGYISDINNYFYYYVMWMYKHSGKINGNGIGLQDFSSNKLDVLLIPLPPLAEQRRIVAKLDELNELLDTIDCLQKQYNNNRVALKRKLIEAAIQGKLTEQLPQDGTAEELFVQIQTEKQALVKAKKIKKDKTLLPIDEAEIPFEIPNTWKWVYLGDIFQHQSGKALNAKDIEGNLYDYITTSNVYWNRLELKNLKKMRFKQTELEKYTIKKGDLLVCEGGDIGRSAIWTYDCEIRFQNHIHRLRGYISDINNYFYYYVMWMYKHSGKINGNGIGLQGFSSNKLDALLIPLPPLAEQRRIVEKLEELLTIIDG